MTCTKIFLICPGELYSDFFQKFLVFSSIPKLSLKTQLSLESVSSRQKHELLLGLH